MNKLLITGGTGLIGSEFSYGTKLSSKDCNLIDYQNVEELFEKEQPEYVIHTAARVGGVKANTDYAGDFFRENILINTNVLEAAKNVKVKKLIAFLSTCIFPDKTTYPLKEEYLHLGEPHSSNFGYAFAKRMVDVQIRAYNQQFGTNFLSVIPTNVYGPKDNFNLNSGHVIPALIHKCYLAKKNNTPLEVWGSGSPLREFIFSKDVARICEELLVTYNSSDPIILSTSEEISIRDVVLLICDIFKFQGKIVWRSEFPDGQFRKPTDNTRLKEVLPNFKFTSMSVGLEESINYFVENYNIVRK
jgi:GDP-L-fucose synthase